MTFAELIKKWNKGIEYGSQAKLAKKVGASTASLANWVKGNYLPNPDMQLKISNELGVSLDELLEALLNTKEEKKSGYVTPADVPVKYAKVVASISSEKFTGVMETAAPADVLPFPYRGKEDDIYALKVVGGVLEPAARDGEYLIVKKQIYADDGQTVIVKTGGQWALKIYKKTELGAQLLSVNKTAPPLKVKPEDLEIEGVIIMSVRKWW
ncbi:MAG: LexA family transcriptional regulator [Elusimicrobia bacterium]|nr:LexA family transcriptional regulator [Elusimicrobiota bacterium]